MANRTIQQKITKMKKRGKKRIYSSQFVNTGQGPKIGAMHELYGNNTGNRLVRNPRTGEINVIGSDEFDRYLNSKFPGYYTSKREIIARGKPNAEGFRKEEPIPLGKVYEFLYRLKKELGETPMKNHFKVKPWMDLFFSADKTVWRLVETRDTFIRKSSKFASKSLAIQCLELEAVKWVETVPLPDSPLPFQ